MRSDRRVSLRFFRSVIRDAWLPIVGRRKLNSRDYEIISEFFETGYPIDAVLKAIKRCAERARHNGYTLYSLGVIRSDLEAVMRDKSKTQVGASKPADENAWRERWRRDLLDLISYVNDPYKSAYQSLLAELDSLSLEQALERWQAIQQLKKV